MPHHILRKLLGRDPARTIDPQSSTSVMSGMSGSQAERSRLGEPHVLTISTEPFATGDHPPVRVRETGGSSLSGTELSGWTSNRLIFGTASEDPLDCARFRTDTRAPCVVDPRVYGMLNETIRHPSHGTQLRSEHQDLVSAVGSAQKLASLFSDGSMLTFHPKNFSAVDFVVRGPDVGQGDFAEHRDVSAIPRIVQDSVPASVSHTPWSLSVPAINISSTPSVSSSAAARQEGTDITRCADFVEAARSAGATDVIIVPTGGIKTDEESHQVQGPLKNEVIAAILRELQVRRTKKSTSGAADTNRSVPGLIVADESKYAPIKKAFDSRSFNAVDFVDQLRNTRGTAFSATE